VPGLDDMGGLRDPTGFLEDGSATLPAGATPDRSAEDQGKTYGCSIQVPQNILDIPGGHPLGIQGNDLIFQVI